MGHKTDRTLVLCAILLYAIGSCTVNKPRGTIPEPSNFTEAIKRTTVTVYASCRLGWSPVSAVGSGVIVSPTQVLTATHVVKCGRDLTHPTDVTIVTDGAAYIAEIDAIESAPDADVARLRIVGGVFQHWAPSTGPVPEIGDVICQSVARPKAGVFCGVVEDIYSATGRLKTTAAAEYGNSGSGAYNMHGELIGIVVRTTLDTGEAIIDYRIDGLHPATLEQASKETI